MDKIFNRIEDKYDITKFGRISIYSNVSPYIGFIKSDDDHKGQTF